MPWVLIIDNHHRAFGNLGGGHLKGFRDVGAAGDGEHFGGKGACGINGDTAAGDVKTDAAGGKHIKAIRPAGEGCTRAVAPHKRTSVVGVSVLAGGETSEAQRGVSRAAGNGGADSAGANVVVITA